MGTASAMDNSITGERNLNSFKSAASTSIWLSILMIGIFRSAKDSPANTSFKVLSTLAASMDTITFLTSSSYFSGTTPSSVTLPRLALTCGISILPTMLGAASAVAAEANVIKTAAAIAAAAFLFIPTPPAFKVLLLNNS